MKASSAASSDCVDVILLCLNAHRQSLGSGFKTRISLSKARVTKSAGATLLPPVLIFSIAVYFRSFSIASKCEPPTVAGFPGGHALIKPQSLKCVGREAGNGKRRSPSPRVHALTLSHVCRKGRRKTLLINLRAEYQPLRTHTHTHSDYVITPCCPLLSCSISPFMK